MHRFSHLPRSSNLKVRLSHWVGSWQPVSHCIQKVWPSLCQFLSSLVSSAVFEWKPGFSYFVGKWVFCHCAVLPALSPTLYSTFWWHMQFFSYHTLEFPPHLPNTAHLSPPLVRSFFSVASKVSLDPQVSTVVSASPRRRKRPGPKEGILNNM